MTRALVDIISSKQAITDIIGTAPMRLYPALLPQGLADFPAAAFRLTSSIPHPDFDGASTYDFGHIDLWSYGQTYGDAVELWETMRTELEGTKGTFGAEDMSGEFAGIDIADIRYMSSGQEDYLDDLELYTKQLELRISYLRLT